MREFAERYYREVVVRSRKDPRNLRRYLDNEILPALGKKVLREVTAADVQSLVFRKRDNGQEAAAAEMRKLIKRIFDYAVVCGAAQVNPALALPTRFITKARSRTRALAPDEIRNYLHTLYSSNVRRQFKLALHLLLLTLVRKSEMLLAQWKDVDLDTGEWQIPAENSKTGRPHIVYLSKQATDLFRGLRALAGDSAWVLPGRGSLEKPFTHNALNQAMGSISFDIDPFTIHDLRRTGSTLLHEKGFSSDVIEKALNHTIAGVRGIYNRAEYSDQRRKMLQFWGDYIEGLATPQCRFRFARQNHRRSTNDLWSQTSGCAEFVHNRAVPSTLRDKAGIESDRGLRLNNDDHVSYFVASLDISVSFDDLIQ